MTTEKQFDFWLVIDVEATTNDDKSLPRHEMEIIEVGGVLVDATSLEAVDEFQSFVSPMRHPRLTKFCSRLTGITDAMLAGAPGFPAMLGVLGERMLWPRRGRLRFASWGDYDEKQWRQDCAFHDVPYPALSKPLEEVYVGREPPVRIRR
jgi:inhibitor of KinA sporulation pathway (predicted exonuclease)